MGRTYAVHCAACGWRASGLRRGSADALGSLEIVLGALEEPNRDEIRDLLDGDRVASRECAFGLYRCPRCRALSSHLNVRLRLTDSTLHETRFFCRFCSGPLDEVTPDQVHGATCPSCGQPALACEAVVSWD